MCIRDSLIIRAYTWPDSCPAFPPSIKNDGAPHRVVPDQNVQNVFKGLDNN